VIGKFRENLNESQEEGTEDDDSNGEVVLQSQRQLTIPLYLRTL